MDSLPPRSIWPKVAKAREKQLASGTLPGPSSQAQSWCRVVLLRSCSMSALLVEVFGKVEHLADFDEAAEPSHPEAPFFLLVPAKAGVGCQS